MRSVSFLAVAGGGKKHYAVTKEKLQRKAAKETTKENTGFAMDMLTARNNMIIQQIKAAALKDEAVLAALAQIPREYFVPQSFHDFAYVDYDIPLEDMRFCWRPLLIARLLALAAITPTDFVLDAGCNYGYVTALAATLGQAAVGLESNASFCAMADKALASFDNAAVFKRSPRRGFAKQAPFDVIILEDILDGDDSLPPPSLVRQAAEGGRIVFLNGKGPLCHAHRMLITGGKPEISFGFDVLIDRFAGR